MSETTPGRVLEAQPRLLEHLFSSAPKSRQSEDVPSLLVSLALHASLVLFVWLGRAHLALTATDAGVGTGRAAGAAGGGGGGGEDVHYVELVAPAAAAPAPRPAPVPEAPPLRDVTPMIIRAVTNPTRLPMPLPSDLSIVAPKAVLGAPAPVEVSGAGTGSGSGTGSGTGPGTGPGSGGGSGGGEGTGNGTGVGNGSGGGRILAPSPEFLLLPPTPAPGNLKGRTIVVRVAIDATGVVRQVELMPSTGDRGYDRSLRETALGWRFRPARDASNRPIAINYDVSFSF